MYRIVISILILLICASAQAKTLTASYYDVASLKRDGQWVITHGKMADGGDFDENKCTAASWDFPLGTRCKVSRVDSQRSVIVIITDRTARRFKGKRIDLSKRAFSKIAPIKWGVVSVKVEKI